MSSSMIADVAAAPYINTFSALQGASVSNSVWDSSTSRRSSSNGSVISAIYGAPLAVLKQILDELSHGLMLVTESGHVRFANRTAKRALDSTPGLKMEGCFLSLCDTQRNVALFKALSACRLGRRAMLSIQVGLAEEVSIAVVPIATHRYSEDGDVVALITLGKRQSYDLLALQFFSQTHQLTHAEGRVLQGLCEGLSSAEIAIQGGVALSTVRSQIRSIAQKTQAKGIREIVGMVALLPPMVSPLETLGL